MFVKKVREHVRKYFNPESFNPMAFRNQLMVGYLTLLLAELVVYIFLQESTELGELPHYTLDIVLIGISSLEFLLGPLISWLGSQRRRSVIVGWTLAGLVTTIPLFALPNSETVKDDGLCTAIMPLSLPAGISAKAAAGLAILLICGVTCALARAAIIAHGMAYLDEHTPSDNLHMHVGIMLLYRVIVYLMGGYMKTMTIEKPWMQIVIMVVKFLLMLVGMFRYPEVAPRVEKLRGADRGLFRSMGRVLGNGVVVLQMLGMALLTAAWWGFGVNEMAFVQVKYYIALDNKTLTGLMNMNIKVVPIVIGVILAGYIYTPPVMAKFDRKVAIASAAKLTFLTAVGYLAMTAALGCRRDSIAGLGKLTYNQPVCLQNCRCDRPWTEFSPVCVPDQMITYFSPCHAGCATSGTVGGVGAYSNCTCAPSGRATTGACDDGSCSGMYTLHQMMFIAISLTTTLVLAWQATVMLETVDKRDVAVAMGLASGIVSLVAFGAAHGFYLGIGSRTCALHRGSKCLLQNHLFVPWVGYTSAILAVLSLLLCVVTSLILRREKVPEEEELSL